LLTNPSWVVRTARLTLVPVNGADLGDLQALKADPRVFAVMLGGVRSPAQTQAELAADIAFWGARGFGIWAIREASPARAFLGITGLMDRPDGRGIALRFALWPEAQGQGLAREAAGAALRFGHERAGLRRIIAVARASNIASRTVLGAIGMTERESFMRDGNRMILYESVSAADPLPQSEGARGGVKRTATQSPEKET
jgi:RimJ/RimL family protein N-acetyltransferase